MPRFSDVFKSFFPTARGAPPPREPSGAVSTLHSLVRIRRPISHYSEHEYEVVIWQNAAVVVVEMRSRIQYSARHDPVSEPWHAQRTFDSLAEARTYAATILADPRQYAETNRPEMSSWLWSEDNRRGRGKPETVAAYERPTGIDDGQIAAVVASGKATLPDGPPAGEIVRQLWRRSEPSARAAVMTFAREAPFTYGSWSHWKWLYKQAEEAVDTGLLPTMITRLDTVSLHQDATPPLSWLEQKPRPATFAYMKRRARRYLRDLATSTPDAYVSLAAAILLQAGSGKREIDLAVQWISLDILYGHSGRYTQRGHGRGHYVCRRRRPSFITPDETAADTWMAHGEGPRDLYRTANLPWQTQEWACRMLLVRGAERPPLSHATLARFLNSPSALLIRTATAEIATSLLSSSRRPGAEVTAQAFYLASGAARQRLTAWLLTAPAMPQWDQQFAIALQKVLKQSDPAMTPTPRRLDAAILLGLRFGALLPTTAIRAIVPLLLAIERAEFMPLLQHGLSDISPRELPPLLALCQNLQEEQRNWLRDLLMTTPTIRQLAYNAADALIGSPNAWVRAVGWQLVSISEMGQAGLNALWDLVLAPTTRAEVLVSALASEAALRALLNAPDKLEGLQRTLQRQPALLAEMPLDAFALVVKRAPLALTLDVLRTMDDELWVRLRDRLLDELRADTRLGAFWQAIWALNAGDPLINRVVSDATMAAGFAEAADPGFLETTNSAFGPLLVTWMAGYRDLFAKGSRPLLAAATHKLTMVRTWALQQVEMVGMSTPFALRLLESGLPDSIATGQSFFDAIAPNDPGELDYALALCDSPDRSVQIYGRAYVEARKEHLPLADLIRRLAEHPDPLIQEMVARTLLETPEAAPETQVFDTQVLRARDRGRRAKELVKKRLTTTPSTGLDTAALLELARSKTPRDATWALEQLARRALAGEQIDGLSIDGVGGI